LRYRSARRSHMHALLGHATLHSPVLSASTRPFDRVVRAFTRNIARGMRIWFFMFFGMHPSAAALYKAPPIKPQQKSSTFCQICMILYRSSECTRARRHYTKRRLSNRNKKVRHFVRFAMPGCQHGVLGRTILRLGWLAGGRHA
jgi:hypothetical protein